MRSKPPGVLMTRKRAAGVSAEKVCGMPRGKDTNVVMKDIAGASREQALDTLEWSARTLVEAALRAKRGRG